MKLFLAPVNVEGIAVSMQHAALRLERDGGVPVVALRRQPSSDGDETVESLETQCEWSVKDGEAMSEVAGVNCNVVLLDDSGTVAASTARAVMDSLAGLPAASPLPGFATSCDAADVDALEELLEHTHLAGLATEQSKYEEQYERVRSALSALEARLATTRFLGGNVLCPADWWLAAYVALATPVFNALFKLPTPSTTLLDYLRDVYTMDALQARIDAGIEAAKTHYFGLHGDRITGRPFVPLGGEPDLRMPHSRYHLRPDPDAAPEAAPHDGAAAGAGAGAGAAPDAAADGKAEGIDGEFVRPRSNLRDMDVLPEPGRYHLIVAFNCPWCHRVVLMRSLKGLEDVISMDVVWFRRDADGGWQFKPDEDGCTTNTTGVDFKFVPELYKLQGSDERSVPVLFDLKEKRIVNNESADIVRILDAFPLARNKHRFYPPGSLRPQIDDINVWVYNDINNGAYKAGFAGSQHAYEVAAKRFFKALRRLDRILASRTWLCGDEVTEADVRLFPTVFRWMPVYYVRFRLNMDTLESFPNLARWQSDFLALENLGAAHMDTVRRHAVQGYFGRTGTGIVPLW